MFPIALAQRTRMVYEENIQEAKLRPALGRYRRDFCSHDEHRGFQFEGPKGSRRPVTLR
jgi:hypothetical protein